MLRSAARGAAETGEGDDDDNLLRVLTLLYLLLDCRPRLLDLLLPDEGLLGLTACLVLGLDLDLDADLLGLNTRLGHNLALALDTDRDEDLAPPLLLLRLAPLPR